jgi:hypothetical protein
LRFLVPALALALGLGSAWVPALAQLPPGRPVPPQAYLGAFPGPSALATFANCVNYLEAWLGPELPDWVVHSSVFTYTARKPLFDGAGRALLGLDGRQACAPSLQSGRIFYPPTWRLPFQRALPLVVYPHFTAPRKQSAPSQFGGHEWLFGAAAALYYGFAVAMPDLPGMGADGASYHPFCHGQSLAYATLDGIPAMRERFAQDPYLVGGGYAWDGRLFVMGYSEGAYAALAAVRELETHAADYAARGGFTLTGSACMAGPFDLSGLARDESVRPGAGSDLCFFLPYLLMAYHHVYGPRLDPREAFAPALLEDREDGNLLNWLDGSQDGFTVNDLIARRLGKPAYRLAFREMLNPAWVARELDDPAYATSALHELLRDNDLHRGWTPTKPILFCHSPADDDVSYQQTVSTMGHLGAQVLRAGGDPKRLLVLRPLGNAALGLTHIQAIPFALPMAFEWFYQGMPAP